MMSFIRDIVHFRARRTPNREAICDWDTGQRYTWKEMEFRAERLACFLVDALGVGKGDRVGFLSANNMLMLDIYYASFETGVVIDTYNHKLLIDELVAMAKAERPRVLFFSNAYWEKALAMQESLDGACKLVCIEEVSDVASCYTLADLEATIPHQLEPVSINFDDPQMLIHTGGTTGLPKAAVLTFRSLFMNSVTGILSLGYTADDVACAGMPLCHTAGWNVTLLPLLLVGGRIVLTKGFSPDTFLDIAKKEKPTVFLAADAMLRAIAAHPRFEDADLSSFKWVMGGGGPVSLCSMEAFWSKGVKLLTGYGMTETGPNNVAPDVTISLEENKAKPFSVGKPLAFTELRIVDSAGNDLDPGGCGEILMRGELSFQGYWGCEEETQNAFEGDWVRTGDIGMFDADGDLTLCGRTKNMYISGGENIFPIEIERCLETHPAIREACVFGVSDDQWGEVGKALVVKKPDAVLDQAELQCFLLDSLSTIKRPRYFEFVSDIPKNNAGKRDEKAIRKHYGI